MTLAQEKLDVYRLSIRDVAWVFDKVETLIGVHRHAREQGLRASPSIPLNLAEGNGKTTEADRRRSFELARGSALECAAIQAVLVVGNALDSAERQRRKVKWDHIAALLSRLGGRGYPVREDQANDGGEWDDPDPDPDFDGDSDEDAKEAQTRGSGNP